MLEIKKKTKAFALIGVVLLVAGSMAYTLAWVTDSQKAKVTSEEVLISKTDELMISLDNVNFYGSIDTTSNVNFKNVNLRDFSGDGINLYSAIIDPYTKKAQNTGWQYIRTDVSEDISEEKKNVLDSNNKNKTYYSFDIYFKSTMPLDVYLYKDSYVKPSSKEMNKLDDGKNYCLFLKRTAKYIDDTTTTYLYETEDGIIGTADQSTKTAFETANLPEIYNRSTYGRSSFDDDVDINEFLEGNFTSEQVMYSTNYIAASTRVAFIDETKTQAPLTEADYDYRTIDTALGSLAELEDYEDSRLRLLWAPNSEIRMKKTYNAVTDGNAYDLDIVNLEETYLNNAGQKIGKSITYPNGAKYYYKFSTVDDPSTSEFLLFVKDDVKYDLDKNKITDVSSSNVVNYNLLIQTTVTTTTNQSIRTGSRIIDGETVSDNRFYSYDGLTATLSSVPSQLFVNDLDYSTTENITDHLNICRLKKKAGTDYYEGKSTAIVWIEGSDPEASIALTAGNGEGLSEKSGIAKIAYCLSFTGVEIPIISE